MLEPRGLFRSGQAPSQTSWNLDRPINSTFMDGRAWRWVMLAGMCLCTEAFTVHASASMHFRRHTKPSMVLGDDVPTTYLEYKARRERLEQSQGLEPAPETMREQVVNGFLDRISGATTPLEVMRLRQLQKEASELADIRITAALSNTPKLKSAPEIMRQEVSGAIAAIKEQVRQLGFSLEMPGGMSDEAEPK